jgi:(p)ppGpp synthase/HD superfamily hydrolase
MRILSKYDFPEEALICAILHDICEDTEATNVQIRELF